MSVLGDVEPDHSSAVILAEADRDRGARGGERVEHPAQICKQAAKLHNR